MGLVNTKQQRKKALKEVEKLKKEGHICVTIRKDNRILWCGMYNCQNISQLSLPIFTNISFKN